MNLENTINKQVCINKMPTHTDNKENLFMELYTINNFLYEPRHKLARRQCIKIYGDLKDEVKKEHHLDTRSYNHARRLVRELMN